MTQASIGFGQYIVSATSQDGLLRATRARAASAVVLAKAWIEAGHANVQILDPLGKQIHPAGYRRAIMGGRRSDC